MIKSNEIEVRKLIFTSITIFTRIILLNNVIQLQLSNAQNFTPLDNNRTDYG
jgi:hypothetical protein